MKNWLMKRRLSLQLVLLMLMLSLVIMNQPVYASEHLEVIGNDVGLEIIPQDDMLFNELNLNPGDILESKVTIRNNYVDSFELYLRTERLDDEPSMGAPDLYQQLNLMVTYKGEQIFSGPMKNFAVGNGIPLGNFNPGEVEDIDVVVHLPGAETGNEFMESTLNNQWIFTAQSDTIIIEEEEPPLGPGEIPDEEEVIIIEEEEIPIGGAKLPQTGGTPASLFFLAGAGIVAMGLVMKKKE